MASAENDHKVFVQCGERFEDILFRGICGGANAIETYLRTRRQMLLRDIPCVQDSELCHYMRALAVFDCAIEVLHYVLALGDVHSEVAATTAATISVQVA